MTKRGRERSGGIALLLAVVAGVALLAAGCGGGAGSPPVASLGTTPSSSGTAGGSSVFAVPPGGAGIGGSISRQVGMAAGVRFTTCMRSHGVPSFPDPDSQGVITLTVSASLDPSAPVFRRAAADCQHLLPPGKTLSEAQQQQMKSRLLAFAACMRAHGVPHYPDPTFGSGGMVSQGFGRGDGVDPTSPTFQAAQKACQSTRGGGG
jgi:hypothetical protein